MWTRRFAELARVTRPHGRVVAVEPDNAARYVYSSLPNGAALFEAAEHLFAALADGRRERSDAVVGPKLPERFARYSIEPVEVRVFPVSHAWLGSPPARSGANVARRWRQRCAVAADAAVSALANGISRSSTPIRRTPIAPAMHSSKSNRRPLFATVGQRLGRAN
jgi:hypothetical protein